MFLNDLATQQIAVDIMIRKVWISKILTEMNQSGVGVGRIGDVFSLAHKSPELTQRAPF